MYASIGSASGKMSRIVAQAESWHDEFGNLFVQSGVSTAPLTMDCPNCVVMLEEINDAMESAASNVSLDLDEALVLKDLGERDTVMARSSIGGCTDEKQMSWQRKTPMQQVLGT
jgi:hypothetical protein